jgi:hypothetical protein
VHVQSIKECSYELYVRGSTEFPALELSSPLSLVYQAVISVSSTRDFSLYHVSKQRMTYRVCVYLVSK